MIYRKPKRIFEKSGAVNPEASYYVPLENVVNTDKQDIKTMVDRGRYFSIFAPRQSGKTTVFKRICSKCKIVRRKNVVRVICSNPKHKQRQG